MEGFAMRRVGEWYHKTWIQLHVEILTCHLSCFVLVGVLFYIGGHDLFVRFFNVEGIIFVNFSRLLEQPVPWRCQGSKLYSPILQRFERFCYQIPQDVRYLQWEVPGKPQVKAIISGTVDGTNILNQLIYMRIYIYIYTHTHESLPYNFFGGF